MGKQGSEKNSYVQKPGPKLAPLLHAEDHEPKALGTGSDTSIMFGKSIAANGYMQRLSAFLLRGKP